MHLRRLHGRVNADATVDVQRLQHRARRIHLHDRRRCDVARKFG